MALAHLAKGGDTERAVAELEEAAAADTGTQSDMALIATHLRQRQVDKALSAIDALEKKLPESPIPNNLRGAALLSKGDVAGARRSFERALALDATYYPAAANLARMDLAQKKPDDAKKRFEAVLAKDPKNTQALLALAKLRAGQGGSTDEVAAMISKAVAANPNDEASRLALIDHYLRNKSPGKAVTAAQDAIAALPNRPQLMEALGRAQRATGDNNQAIATFRKLAEIAPGSPLPYLRMAEAQIASKSKDKAMESLRQVLAIKPDYVEAQRAVIALDLDAGRLPQAVAMARDVQKQRPKQSVGFIFEGDIYASKKKWNEAAAAYRAGLKQVGSVDLAFKLHSMLRTSGNHAEADKFATSWLADHPKDDVFRLYLAEYATARKDYATAIQHYRVLLETHPNDPKLLNNLAWVLGQAKDPQALEFAEKAYKLAPNSPNLLDTLGVLLVEKGDTARGLELLQKASGLAPGNASIRLNLAKALLKAGQNDAAKKELEVLEKLGGQVSGPSRGGPADERFVGVEDVWTSMAWDRNRNDDGCNCGAGLRGAAARGRIWKKISHRWIRPLGGKGGELSSARRSHWRGKQPGSTSGNATQREHRSGHSRRGGLHHRCCADSSRRGAPAGFPAARCRVGAVART